VRAKVLEREGYEVVSAVSAEHAVQEFRVRRITICRASGCPSFSAPRQKSPRLR
jgi:hypothetical protein